MLERYGHGGDLRTAEENFGRPADQFVDFSSNMNPLGPPPLVHRVLLSYAQQIGKYPDPAVRGLRAKLAKLHGIDEQCILIGNGAAELIDLTVRAVNPIITSLAFPCFSEYGDAVHKISSGIAPIMLNTENGFELTEEAIQSMTTEMEEPFYMLGSPNNPTGRLVQPAIIKKLLAGGATVVVDEAFMDFVPEEADYSLVKEAAGNDRLYVIRSMTKFYAIPGIRLGYVVSTPERIAELRLLQVPWSVNSLAQLIGEGVLEDAEYAAETLKWLNEERPWLTSQLEGLGFSVTPSETNYVLVRLPSLPQLTAAALQQEMGSRGVLIRDASHFVGLDDRYCRFAIKLRSDNEKLLEALAQCLDDFKEDSRDTHE
ncbi:threonine-phosphate decarboxylase [Paenibacillus sp. BIHB 4019]|uniref:Aminotransferase n=1 Tax=Paenibacillus sp. BIHB 4019 TaxID=1870819 RepID=A0A1B2DPF0_9BACL|nr:threonine-phosphate decarboxylase [Paenibacillus sp. BIHB 4019]ANY69581.1 threonine-phosphate decarboxylase [Paenibacillus sp. BIHB 4019]